jgi:biopolymer transport protein ExbD
MSQPFGNTRERRKPGINITPLIDVLFLLLIFFMVSSTFKDDMAIDISLPQAGTASNQDITPLEIAVDRSGAWFLAGNPVDEARLRAGLQQALQADPKATFVLRADEAADFGRVVRAIDIARDVGGERLIIPTAPLDASRPGGTQNQ